jgi:hypothetical protein
MNKYAQQTDSPLLTTPIDSELSVVNIWNKYFAEKHSKIVKIIRTNIKTDPALHTALSSSFPGFEWPEFADTPTKNTFVNIKNALDKIMAVPQAKASIGVEAAVQAYMDQYNAMLKQLQSSASKQPPRAKKPTQPSQKVKELQSLLSVEQTGFWSQQTNVAFLDWLKTHGWNKYISNGKFTGNINDAITTILAENTPAETENPVQRQADRLARLKKLGI